MKEGGAALTTATIFFIFMFIGSLFATRWLDHYFFTGPSFQKSFLTSRNSPTTEAKFKYELNCSYSENTTQTCPTTNYPKIINTNYSSAGECPEYFRWIHEDLRTWQKTGITKEIVESGIPKANTRIVILDGKLYLEQYSYVYQTRDVFTVWGLLQLLKFYPGKLPDLDFMFDMGDKPRFPKKDYMGMKASTPPPVFHYCADDSTLDLVFPDWSFWGWPEINIKPWVSLKNELKEGSKRMKWWKREAYAYWQGNARVSRNRRELMKCSVTDKYDWNARLYRLDWIDETNKGFKHSNLADQCTHRYKIYVEGKAWSVSEKYILACDSMTLLINPRYYDFFTRGLQPLVHYWPTNTKDTCKSIKFAVDWGNSHPKKAQKIGRAGSKFIQEGLKMKNIYDYMFHTLNEYSKLMTYKPTIPPGAVEVCPETMACREPLELNKKFKIESMVKAPSDSAPCILPPPYTPQDLHALRDKKARIIKEVEKWEKSGN